MEERKAVIKAADMTDEMQQDAVDVAVQVRGEGRARSPPLPNARRFGKSAIRGSQAGRLGGRTSLCSPSQTSPGSYSSSQGCLAGHTRSCAPLRRTEERKKEDGPLSPRPRRGGPLSPLTARALCLSHQAIDKYSIEKDIATFVKKEFDKKHTPTWHCVVGRNFGEKREES